jgi:periplasmic copper chaperone A
MRTFLAVLAACLIAAPALSHSITAGDLEIIHPHIPQPSASAKAAAAYFGITNSGADADRLIGVEVSVAASAMLHLSSVNAEGVASMAHVDFIDLPAGETTLLEPGGYHVMVMGPSRALIEGEMVPGALIFEKAGRVEVEFAIDPPGGADHSTMNH